LVSRKNRVNFLDLGKGIVLGIERLDFEFTSLGATLRGWLFLPQEVNNLPAVIMTHGFTATRTMTVDKYGEVFAEAGFAALVYDHRGFGASDGEPRREINHFFQAKGYRDAITALSARPEIDADRIAIWGDSLSGNVSLMVAAIDDRPAVVVAQVPGCGMELPPPDVDGSAFAAYAEILNSDDIMGLPRDTSERRPVVMPDPMRQPCFFDELSAWRWFIEHGARLNSKWENDTQRSVMKLDAPYSVVHCAPHVKVPTLLMFSYEDEIPNANPDVTRHVFELLAGPKQKCEIAGGHFGLLWHPSELFDEAAKIQTKFLKDHL
jgi:pimeloyl-ACP methyl ester carboxylesterase